MNRTTWKNHEKAVARLFGSERTPLSGGNGRITRSDTLCPWIFFELKSGNVPRRIDAIHRLYAAATVAAQTLEADRHKLVVLVLHANGSSDSVENWLCYLRLWDGSAAGAFVAMRLKTLRVLTREHALPKDVYEGKPDPATVLLESPSPESEPQ